MRARALNIYISRPTAYIGTNYSIDDFFTKGLTSPKFSEFRAKLGMIPAAAAA